MTVFFGCPAFAARAQEATAGDPGALFAAAAKAYDAGRLDECIGLYTRLAATGNVPMEVHFNLGNAWFRKGNLGRTVLEYRRAWRIAPRDPDIAANLRFALQAAGATPPEPSLMHRLLQRLSDARWTVVLWSAYALASVLAGALILRRGRGPWLWRGLVTTLVVLAAAGAGRAEWRGFARRPEAVVLAAGCRALFAPLPDATVHFALPPGSIVRMEERQGAWLKVDLNGRAGWIEAAACERVLME